MGNTFQDKLKRLVAKGKQNFIVLLALLVLIVIFSILNKNFVDRYNIVSMVQSLAPYAVLARASPLFFGRPRSQQLPLPPVTAWSLTPLLAFTSVVQARRVALPL